MNRQNFIIKKYYNRSENQMEYHLTYKDKNTKTYYGYYDSMEEVHDKINKLLDK